MGHIVASRPAFMAPQLNEFDEFIMDYEVGDMVRSMQFGEGEIIDVDGMAVSVRFASGMTKKLNVEYARLEKLS